MKTTTDYVTRKIMHMQRMGIACSMLHGAAASQSRIDELRALEKRAGVARYWANRLPRGGNP